jgi:hypothetical protein
MIVDDAKGVREPELPELASESGMSIQTLASRLVMLILLGQR